jgi:hypothetical protein
MGTASGIRFGFIAEVTVRVVLRRKHATVTVTYVGEPREATPDDMGRPTLALWAAGLVRDAERQARAPGPARADLWFGSVRAVERLRAQAEGNRFAHPVRV